MLPPFWIVGPPDQVVEGHVKKVGQGNELIEGRLALPHLVPLVHDEGTAETVRHFLLRDFFGGAERF